MRTPPVAVFRAVRQPLLCFSSGLALGAMVFGLLLHQRVRGFHEHLDFAIGLASAKHIILELQLDPLAVWVGLEAEFGESVVDRPTESPRLASLEDPERIRFIVTEAVIASLRDDLATMSPDHGARSLYERTIRLAEALQERDFERLEGRMGKPAAALLPDSDLSLRSRATRSDFRVAD